MAIVELDRVSKTYGTFPALKSLSLSVEEGDLYGFIGPNGAGKTTTIRILSTLLLPTQGTAYVGGINVVTDPYAVKQVLGYMPDNFGLYDGMRLREYLDFFGAAYKIPARKRVSVVDDVLELTNMTKHADDFVSNFSRGMKQRACLAKTLIHDPLVLLLDEPASGLDPRARIEIRELLKKLRDNGKTILISSHILSELGDMCNKIAVIDQGKLLANGDYRAIMREMRQDQTLRIEVLDGSDAAKDILEAMESVNHVEQSGNEFQVRGVFGREEIAALHGKLVAGDVQVLFLEQEKENLEDFFLEVTKEGV